MSDAAPPVSLVAVRDRREAAIQLLTDSFAADLLSVDQFDQRLELAHSASTVAELDALVADLAPPPSPVPTSTALVPISIDASLSAPPKRLRTLFGNLERHGAWVVPGELAVAATFGNAVLDFREARFTAQTTVIAARVVFGNLEIIVPPQLAVECEGESVFGNVESHGGGAVADPGRPLLRIHGRAVFGNIEVHTRLPGESARDAAKRTKRERKALAAAPRPER